MSPTGTRPVTNEVDAKSNFSFLSRPYKDNLATVDVALYSAQCVEAVDLVMAE